MHILDDFHVPSQSKTFTIVGIISSIALILNMNGDSSNIPSNASDSIENNILSPELEREKAEFQEIWDERIKNGEIPSKNESAQVATMIS